MQARTRMLLGSGIAVAVGLGLASAIGPPGSAAERVPTRVAGKAKLSELRVCTSTAFSRSQSRCTKDERMIALLTNRITCSVKVVIVGRATIRGHITYNRHVAYELKPIPLRDEKTHVWMNENIKINQPLPGGSWGCVFTLASARAAVSFTSGGPTGPIVDTAVCGPTNTATFGVSGFRFCLSDQSGAPLAATNPVYCSAVYPDDTGHSATIDITFQGRSLATPVNFSLDGTLLLGYAYYQVPGGQNLQPGDYSCRFSLDGTLVTEKPFQIAV